MTTGNTRKTRRILERIQAKETKKTRILENTRYQEKNTKQTVLELATLQRIRAMPADILRYIWDFVPSTVKAGVMNVHLRSIMREQIEYKRNTTYKEPELSRLLQDVPLHIIEKFVQTPTIETLYAEFFAYIRETMHEYCVKYNEKYIKATVIANGPKWIFVYNIINLAQRVIERAIESRSTIDCMVAMRLYHTILYISRKYTK